MNKNLTVVKLILGVLFAMLVSGSVFAVQQPFGYNGGIYHNEVLPNGTVTGPIGPQVNGG
jgi:hypothetical protein